MFTGIPGEAAPPSATSECTGATVATAVEPRQSEVHLAPSALSKRPDVNSKEMQNKEMQTHTHTNLDTEKQTIAHSKAPHIQRFSHLKQFTENAHSKIDDHMDADHMDFKHHKPSESESNKEKNEKPRKVLTKPVAPKPVENVTKVRKADPRTNSMSEINAALHSSTEHVKASGGGVGKKTAVKALTVKNKPSLNPGKVQTAGSRRKLSEPISLCPRALKG